jgi:hypothetical protein
MRLSLLDQGKNIGRLASQIPRRILSLHRLKDQEEFGKALLCSGLRKLTTTTTQQPQDKSFVGPSAKYLRWDSYEDFKSRNFTSSIRIRGNSLIFPNMFPTHIVGGCVAVCCLNLHHQFSSSISSLISCQ